VAMTRLESCLGASEDESGEACLDARGLAEEGEEEGEEGEEEEEEEEEAGEREGVGEGDVRVTGVREVTRTEVWGQKEGAGGVWTEYERESAREEAPAAAAAGVLLCMCYYICANYICDKCALILLYICPHTTIYVRVWVIRVR
jgi:hypothetical protein